MIRSDALDHPFLSHGFFTRQGGHSQGLYASLNCGLGSGDDKPTVKRNREVVAAALGIVEPRLLSAHQVHSATAVAVTGCWTSPERPRADAMVTASPSLAIGVLTADCGPILFADRKARVIGVAHAGWKGALSGITAATLEAMETLGASRHNITAVIGPMISGAAYEVGPEFPARFIEADAMNRRFFTPSGRAGHSRFDLAGYLEKRLRDEAAGEVIKLDLCTFTDEKKFFSYRRTTHRGQSDYGRQISAIALI
ncbi:MAG: peptidoglycan editing factor PgeF [Rhizobiales bacterium]|nr:peptidoglycan editing factor PgeF [Hyphomicrobiales bacterium]